MTNIDRAAEIISLATRGAHTTDGHPMKMSDHTAQIIAASLADAGLLMPDLPEPDGCDADGLPYWGEGDYNTALTWHPCDRDVPRDERPLLIHSPISPWMHPDELEAEGLRALAAARAARQALEAANDRWNLPSHRTEAGYPNCSTCDGGGCPDCTDPA